MPHRINTRATIQILTYLLILWISKLPAVSNNLPKSNGFVNDFAEVFTTKEERQLEDSLQLFYKKTGIQIGIAIENSLNGKDKYDRALELARGWGVGKKGENTGLLIYIATTERKYHILVAQGLQGKLPDGLIGEMARNELVPFLKENDYFGGCQSIIKSIQLTVQNDFKYTAVAEPWYIEWIMIPTNWIAWLLTLGITLVIISIWIWGILPNLKQQSLLKAELNSTNQSYKSAKS